MVSQRSKPKYKDGLSKRIKIERLKKHLRKILPPHLRELEQKIFEIRKVSEQEKKLGLLARHFGMSISYGLAPIDPQNLRILLLRLAEAHVNGFRASLEHGATQKPGPTKEEVEIFLKVEEISSKKTLSVNAACQHVARDFRTKGRGGKPRTAESVRLIYRRTKPFFSER
jgi:hypothetical protein